MGCSTSNPQQVEHDKRGTKNATIIPTVVNSEEQKIVDQAIALFKLIDRDDTGELNKSELLALMTLGIEDPSGLRILIGDLFEKGDIQTDPSSQQSIHPTIHSQNRSLSQLEWRELWAKDVQSDRAKAESELDRLEKLAHKAITEKPEETVEKD